MAVVLRENSCCGCNGSQWKVKLAQFVRAPSLRLNNTDSWPFKLLYKHHFPANGTWISSSTHAIISVSTISSGAKLRVVLHGKIHEEHFISRLKFAWPKTACQARFGTLGSRVLFACYNQESLHKGFERSKFALQFDTALHAQDFLSVIKNYDADECLLLENDTVQADELSQPEEEIPRSIILWDKSSPSQPLALHKPQIRENKTGAPLDEANKQEKICSTLEAGQSMKKSEKQEILNQVESICRDLPSRFSSYSEQSHIKAHTKTEKGKIELPNTLDGISMLNQVESICRDLPPRFSSYLEESHITAHTKTEKGKIELPKSLNGNSFAVDNTEHLKEQVAACFMDPSFQDFVSKVEKVWGELNIDL